MAFDYIVLDSELSVNGWKNRRKTDANITKTGSESETRFSRSPWPRKTYEIPWQHLARDQQDYLVNFYDARNGPVRSFLLWDRNELHVVGGRVGLFDAVAGVWTLANGDGTTTAFQAGVVRGDAARTFFKPILHPIPTNTDIPLELRGLSPGLPKTATRVTLNGVTKVEGTDYTVDPLTGVLLFATAPANAATIRIDFWYYTTVRFDDSDFELILDGLYGEVTTGLVEVFYE